MSREIKFRAWDEIEEKYNNDTDIILTLNGDYCVDKGWVRLFPKLTLEQYIGLKDKNGKEIYEGDIVKVFSTDEYVASFEGVYRVYFDDNWLSYQMYKVQSSYSSIAESFEPEMSTNIEVIGNIHENPELLGGGK